MSVCKLLVVSHLRASCKKGLNCVIVWPQLFRNFGSLADQLGHDWNVDGAKLQKCVYRCKFFSNYFLTYVKKGLHFLTFRCLFVRLFVCFCMCGVFLTGRFSMV